MTMRTQLRKTPVVPATPSVSFISALPGFAFSAVSEDNRLELTSFQKLRDA
jgi:hypothetical protein